MSFWCLSGCGIPCPRQSRLANRKHVWLRIQWAEIIQHPNLSGLWALLHDNKELLTTVAVVGATIIFANTRTIAEGSCWATDSMFRLFFISLLSETYWARGIWTRGTRSARCLQVFRYSSSPQAHAYWPHCTFQQLLGFSEQSQVLEGLQTEAGHTEIFKTPLYTVTYSW